MPVLATIATINVLFRGGATDRVGFLEPVTLRARIERELGDAAVRDRALALVDELERIALRYDRSLMATIEAYVAESSNPRSRSHDLVTILDSLDRGRRAALDEIVGIRRSMHNLLTVAQWDSVFR